MNYNNTNSTLQNKILPSVITPEAVCTHDNCTFDTHVLLTLTAHVFCFPRLFIGYSCWSCFVRRFLHFKYIDNKNTKYQ